MNGLRVYTIPQNTPPDGKHVFYSRRENGPYYCWSYVESERQWRVARVNSTNFSPRVLSMTSWKVVPPALQKSMVEHYQD